MTYRLRVAVDGPLRAAAENLEATVFWRWFGNSRAELATEYGPYDASSFFLVVEDVSAAAELEASTVVGALRVIRSSPAGLKTLVDIADPPWSADQDSTVAAGLDVATTWDVTTVAVADDVRRSTSGGIVSLALYHGLYACSRVNGCASWVAILDDHVFALMAALGIPFRRFPGTASAPYLGSPASSAVYLNVQEGVETTRKHHPQTYSMLALGLGLIDVELPTFGELVLEPAESVIAA